MEPTGVKRKLAVILTAAIAPALAACESGPPAVSLEEAKQITARFEGESFVPPPRTINDITAIFDQEKVADPSLVRRLLAQARAQLPKASSGRWALNRHFPYASLSSPILPNQRPEDDGPQPVDQAQDAP